MEDIFIIGIIMSVPITGIIAGVYLKIKRMEFDRHKIVGSEQNSQEVLRAVAQLNKENLELKQRVENLETIVTLGENITPSHTNNSQMNLPPHLDSSVLKKEAQKIADEILKRR